MREGTGGMQSLGDDDKANIRRRSTTTCSRASAIAFRSTAVTGADGRLSVQGELTLAGATRAARASTSTSATTGG